MARWQWQLLCDAYSEDFSVAVFSDSSRYYEWSQPRWRPWHFLSHGFCFPHSDCCMRSLSNTFSEKKTKESRCGEITCNNTAMSLFLSNNVCNKCYTLCNGLNNKDLLLMPQKYSQTGILVANTGARVKHTLHEVICPLPMDRAYSQANYQGPHIGSPADNLTGMAG